MANTREYMDYLDDHIEIAPANSEEEYQASEVIAGIFRDHGLETMVEGFDTHPSGTIFLPILMCVMFVCLIVSGVTEGSVHYITLLVSAVCAGLSAFGHFTDNNVLANLGPASQSQNVIGVHRATGDKVVKGARPIVIVAHYDTPRESLLRKGPVARYMVMLRRITVPMVLTVAVTIVLQAIPFLPGVIRTFAWVVGLLCCVPVLFVSVADIADHFASCTPGSNDNKSSLAALLSIVNKVRPGYDRVDKAMEEGYGTTHARVGDEAVINPVPRLIQVVEETKGVRHGADVLLSLGILPPTCDVVYEEPRVTVMEEGAIQQEEPLYQDDLYQDEYAEALDEPDFEEESDELAPAYEESDDLSGIEDEVPLDDLEASDQSEEEYDEQSSDDEYLDYEEDEDYDEDYDEDDYDEDDYDEDYEDEDDGTPSSLGIWFSERLAGIREFFSKNRGSDVDIDRGEDLTQSNDAEADAVEELQDEDTAKQAAEDSVDEFMDFADEADDDYDFEDLYPEEIYLEEEEPASEVDDDTIDEDLSEDEAVAEKAAEDDSQDDALGTEDEQVQDAADDADEEDVPTNLDELAEGLTWDDDFAEEAIATDQGDLESDAVENIDSSEDRSDYDAEWIDDNEDEYEYEEAADSAPSLMDRIKSFFRGLGSSDEQEDDFEEYDAEDYEEDEYAAEEYAEDEEEESLTTDEDGSEAPRRSGRHYVNMAVTEDSDRSEDFVEDDLYVDEEIEEPAYYVEDEYEDFEEVLEEVPQDEPSTDEESESVAERLVDPNLLHFDYEEDADIVPRDTTGLDTISDSYDLYADEVERVAPKHRPQPVEDPSWGITSYQPPRPAMNIARRAALLDLPDPSEDFVDPLASYAYSYEPYAEYNPYDGQPVDGQTLLEEDIELDEAYEVDEYVEDEYIEEEYAEVEDTEEEYVEEEYVEDDLDDLDGFEDPDVDTYQEEQGSNEDDEVEESAQEAPHTEEHGSFWGSGASSNWKGGAAKRMDMREDAPLVIDADELQDAILELGDEYLVAHDIWFVATGASESNHAGIQAFVDAHRKDIRGAFLVNLDSIGAGSLALVVSEGLHVTRRADRRLVRLLTSIAQDLHIQLETALMNWTDKESTITARSRLRSVTITGIDDNVLPAYSHTMDDVPEQVDPRQVSNVVRMVTELVRRS